MEISTQLFLCLLAAHLVADFLLQSDQDIEGKRRPLRFAKHIAVVTGTAFLFVGNWTEWRIPLIIAGTHAAIDLLKLRAESQGWRGRWPYLIDQAAHLAVLFGIIYFLPIQPLEGVAGGERFAPVYFNFCLILSGLLATVYFGGYLIGHLVEPYYREIRPANETSILPSDPVAEGLARGGLVIGQLERALIFFFVLVGQPEAVAFLVAAKSVFRFGELSKSRKEAEYILIGTLMSFAWGLVLAWTTGWFLRYLN